MNFKITKPEISDAKDIIDYINTVRGETNCLKFGANEVETTIKEEENFLKDLGKSRIVFLIAKNEKGDIIGSAKCTPNKGRMSHVGNFAISVKKDYWGKGIGRSLMEQTLTEAKNLEIEKVVLGVNTENKRAIEMYKKFGFEIEGLAVKSIKINDKYYDELLMARFF